MTRGMLIIDRREDESAYAPGANRAEVQAQYAKHSSSRKSWESTALPAPVEIELAPVATLLNPGIFCINETPGPDILLSLLLKRVWGV